MIFVLVMSQHVGDNSFNLVRFAIAIGCQRFVIFLMTLRCRIVLLEKSFILSAYCTQYLVASAMYFVFAIGIAFAPDHYTPLSGKFRYIAIIAVIETLWNFSYLSPFFANHRLPLHVPHMRTRIGDMMLVSVGEVSISLTQCARPSFMSSVLHTQLDSGTFHEVGRNQSGRFTSSCVLVCSRQHDLNLPQHSELCTRYGSSCF
jgi:hypothetical protein